ncbi:hypothetical protein ACFOWE_20625 [Planomonospora corallina]|uniref:Uncharacterized protein n=1 Tax=Planomonospora corallina TaxID=1806052 RepID=A0ABV8ICF1_9ACTN
MGSHGVEGEEPLHHGGGPEANTAPLSAGGERPAGRRLRPEQGSDGAAGGPLGSRGETGRGSADAPGPDGWWRSGVPARAALLAVTAVVAMMGGAVAGVQEWKSSAGPVPNCPPGECVAASDRPPAEEDTTGPAGEDVPAEEPTPGAEAPGPERGRTATPAPSPVRTTVRPRASRTPEPRPGPRATHRPADDGPVSSAQEDSRAEGPSGWSPAGDEEPVVRDATSTAQTPSPLQDSQSVTPAPSPTATPPGSTSWWSRLPLPFLDERQD